MRKLIKTIILSICFLIVFASFSFAAEETELTEEQREMFLHNCKELGIEDSVALRLIEKLEQGVLPDSDSEEYMDISPSEIIELENGTKYRYIYPDGSVRECCVSGGVKEGRENDLKNEELQPCYIGGGEASGGSGYMLYKGVQVTEGTSLGTMGFKADYEFRADGTSCINKVYDPELYLALAALQSEELSIRKQYGDEYYPAVAEYRVVATRAVTMTSRTLVCQLKVYSTWAESAVSY